MTYSAINKKSVITQEALITAISIGKWLQGVALNAFSEVGHTAFSKAETVVLGILKKHKKVYRRYLQQWVYKKAIDGDLLTKVVNVLVKNGQIVEGKEKTAAGRERPWVEYIPNS